MQRRARTWVTLSNFTVAIARAPRYCPIGLLAARSMALSRPRLWFRRSLPAKLAVAAAIFVSTVASVHVLSLDRLTRLGTASSEVRNRWLDFDPVHSAAQRAGLGSARPRSRQSADQRSRPERETTGQHSRPDQPGGRGQGSVWRFKARRGRGACLRRVLELLDRARRSCAAASLALAHWRERRSPFAFRWSCANELQQRNG